MAEFEVCVRVAEVEVARVSVGEGELVLVGRRGARIELDPDELASVPERLRARVRRVEVDSEHVSRKHCLVWADGGQLRVRDLRSALGTQVSVAGAETLSTAADAVELSLVPTSRAGLDQPDPVDLAAVRGEGDFAEALARSVREWARARGVQFAVEVEAREGQVGRSEDGLRLRVGAQHALSVSRGHRTARVPFDLARDALARYVASQNAQFVAVLQGARRAALALPTVAASAAMQQVCWRVAQCAVNDLRVILLGETGVGKTLMARRYHEAAGGAEFVTIDCTQYEDVTRLRAELFGAEPGAWTGLTRRHVGAFERARNGTVFIDEVGDLAQENQGQLLTFLDGGRFTRVLGTEEFESNARVVCGTRQDLRRAVREGRFREDLWYRLAGMVVTIPPLRERPEDVEALLAAQVVRANGREVAAAEALTPEARRRLLAYAWPGNTRELEMFCRRLPLFLDGAERADVARCEAALRAGDPGASPEASPSRPAPPAERERDGAAWRSPVTFDDGVPTSLAPVSWGGVIEEALRDYAIARGLQVDDEHLLGALFRVDAPDGETTVGAFKDFVDKHFKPRFAARATGVEGLGALPSGFVAEHWKNALGFGDGTSIRQLLHASFALDRRRAACARLQRLGLASPEALKELARRDVDDLDPWLAGLEREARGGG